MIKHIEQFKLKSHTGKTFALMRKKFSFHSLKINIYTAGLPSKYFCEIVCATLFKIYHKSFICTMLNFIHLTLKRE